ncbi:MAG: phosphoglycerate dehydrogenase [Nitrososphaeria archaeon]|nr:phosphoglycerate dehydrogenase [Nitrososphaeria archaeon]MDW8021300.1 phosphoglycerate dehydrogenase [Nitrososphaerota archaeon]
MEAKILITSRSYGRHYPDQLERLKRLGDVVYAENPPLKEDKLLQIIDQYNAIVAGLDEYTGKVLEKASDLKILARYGVGLDNVDLKKATELGIIVTYTPGANTIAVAEHTFALILSLIKNIPRLNEVAKRGEWAGRRELNRELYGKVLGIIGLGSIGRAVAAMAKGFGMEVIAYSPHVKKEDAERLGVKLVSLEELLQKSDVISIHTSYSPEKYHLIGEKELGLMKKTAYLINTARGELVDEKALINALKKGAIAGAALDVFEKEPPSLDNELLKLDNVIVTPHAASHTWEAVRRMGEMVTEDIEAALSGIKPKNMANPEVLQRSNLRIKLKT